MSLPVTSGERAVRTVLRAGWTRDRQVGSHAILIQHGHCVVLGTPSPRGALLALIRASGLSVQQFQDML